MTHQPHVLVVGAGPTGLALALQANDHGARVRIVERRPEAFRPSRALIVHPRTLEVLRPLGVVDALLARADIAPRALLHLGSRVVPVELTRFALPDTAYPHLSLLRQADVEAVLGAALDERGIEVERGTELVGLEVRGGRPRPVLRSAAGVQPAECDFVAGCDGTASTVRMLAGIGWPGAAYPQEIVLADVELAGELTPGVAHVVAGRRGLLFAFAMGERATWRLLGTRPAGGSPPAAVPIGELQGLLDGAGLDARITEVRWSSPVRVQHRLATAYRRGRLFLAGDAAHTHSPAAAQGMNTGIQDAVNLGWKLAFAAASTSPLELLDSYQKERRPVARATLAATHLVFWAEAGTDPVAALLRGVLAPLGSPALPLILGRRRLVAQGIRMLSQLRVSYRGSPLSVEGVPRPPGRTRAGDRLPDATVTSAGHQVRLHELLARPGVHVLLHRDAPAFTAGGDGRYVHVHRLAGTPGRGVVAVRPDGHVGFRAAVLDDTELTGWLALVGGIGRRGGT